LSEAAKCRLLLLCALQMEVVELLT